MQAARTRSRSMVIGLVVASAVLVGCGSSEDGDDGGEALPAPGATTFGGSPLDEIPLPPEAEPVGPLSEQEGIAARSYAVPDLAPTDAIEFYERALADDGWTAQGIEELPQGFRGDWTDADQTLRVSVNQAPGLDQAGDEPQQTQISLVLSPRSATTIPDTTAPATDG